MRPLWRRGRFAVIVGLLALLYLGAALAPVVAPYTPRSQQRQLSYAPPRRPHWIDRQGRLHARPFVYALDTRVVEGTRLYTESDRRLPIYFWTAGEPYRWLGLPLERHLFGLEPGQQPWFPLGADRFGRDLFTRLLYGSQISLTIGPVAIVLTLLVGLLAGGLAGYRGGWYDVIAMRLAELLLSLPGLFLLLALRAVFPSDLSAGSTYAVIVLLFALVGWASVARVVRGIVLGLKQEEYVQAAQALGGRHTRIFMRHLLPGLRGYLLVQATFLVPAFMLAEVTLSFLGLGIQEPDASWGNLLTEALSVHTLRHHSWILIPAALIFLAAFCFHWIGDQLAERFDPRGR